MSTLEVKSIQAPTGYDLQMPAGSVLQVVNATYDIDTTTTSGSYIDTGLTATITPKFASSKIIVHISQNGVSTSTSNGGVYGQLVRGSSVLGYLGRNVAYTGDTSQVRIGTGWSCSWLDSPSTTSATTYKTQWKAFNGESAIIQQSEAHSTITLMEVSV